MLTFGTPFAGVDLEKLKAFLEDQGLEYEDGIQYTVEVLDESLRILATGSLQDNVIKCVAVSPDHRNAGLTEQIVTELTKEGLSKGHRHLFLFTKPENRAIFGSIGFSEIVQTDDVVFMENIPNGVERFVRQLENADAGGVVGSVVCNCNPFTNGHLYLIEQSSARCDWLHVFVVSENKSVFPAQARLEMVRKGTAHLKNITVHPTGPYLISSATFPTYFIKDRISTEKIRCELDLKIFYVHFALPLGIKRRFIGTEPYCKLTAAYNTQMKHYLTAWGLEVVELQRAETGGRAISASYVRQLLQEGDYHSVKQIVPESTWQWIHSPEGRKTVELLRGNVI